MRVLVCGGRGWWDRRKLFDVLDAYGKATVIIHGNARGADKFGGMYAKYTEGVSEEVYPADWDKYKKAAGPIRNKQMLDEGKPDIVFAFGGNSGTDHMVSIAQAAGVTVVEVDRE